MQGGSCTKNSRGVIKFGTHQFEVKICTGTVCTPIGSGDELDTNATLAGVDAELAFKAAKGKKKMSRKQMKDREERRRLRTGEFHSILLSI